MWFKKSVEETISLLETNSTTGLSNNVIDERIAKYGENKLIEKKKKSIFQLIIAQLNDILIYILLAAAIISIAVGEIADGIIILFVIIINAVIGVIQESKAEKAMEALKKLSSPKAVVKRDGKIQEIDSEKVVPGDIVMIDAGRYLPCDLRLIESVNLKIEESALTGESVPVEKYSNEVYEKDNTPLGDQKNMAFMSTLCTYGRGVGVAVETGMNTQIGKIATMLEEQVEDLSPLQKKIEELGKVLGIAALAICAIMFVVGMLQGRAFFEMFLTAISLAVAAIPEGLPAIITIVLAIGVQKMVKEHAIIRKLPAVETLGAVNVICSDKTGTLTQNKMTVTKYYADGIKSIKEFDINNPVEKLLLENIMLCNDATLDENSSTGDPTEIALLQVGKPFDIIKNDIDKEYKRVFEYPFDSDRKLMTTVNKFNDDYYVLTKGAIDNLLKICNRALINGKTVDITDEIKDEIMKNSNFMSDEALRVLGSAYKIVDKVPTSFDNLENDLTLIGLVGMIDPPREEVKGSIETCVNSGIKTIMITGDHKNTAVAIAKELKIANGEDEAIFGVDLDRLSDDEIDNKIDKLRVFARVSPEHKVRIVKAFKRKGNIVSMTGDGVNDAPSLKMADIGVAMGITGTDVSKGASDMILTDDNFATIVKAVEEGRNIFNNIKKSIMFLLSCNLGEIITLFLAIILNWATPLKPIHILWVNLITDSFPALSLGADPGDKDIMKEKPRDPKQSLFKNNALPMILNGILIGVISLAGFIIGIKIHSGDTNILPLYPAHLTEEALMYGQTMAFIILSVSQLVHSLNMRHNVKSIFQIGLFSNKYLIYSIILGLVLQIGVVSIPFLQTTFSVVFLTLTDWIIVFLLSLLPLVCTEIVKVFIRLKNK